MDKSVFIKGKDRNFLFTKSSNGEMDILVQTNFKELAVTEYASTLPVTFQEVTQEVIDTLVHFYEFWGVRAFSKVFPKISLK